jgi:hypothetical protein
VVEVNPSNPVTETPRTVARREFVRRFLLEPNMNDRDQVSWLHGYEDAVMDQRRRAEGKSSVETAVPCTGCGFGKAQCDQCKADGALACCPECSHGATPAQNDPPWADDPENPKNQMARPCPRCAAAEADFVRVHHNCIHAREVADRALKLLTRLPYVPEPEWQEEFAAVFELARNIPPLTAAPEALCPHGFVLADNLCGPCSEGRPNRVAATTTWQPIETAPQDSPVLVSGFIRNDATQPRWRLIAINRGDRWTECDDTATASYGDIYPPTHWMPLPDVPFSRATSRCTCGSGDAGFHHDDDCPESTMSAAKTSEGAK